MINLKRYYYRLLVFSSLLFLATVLFAILAADWMVSDACLFFVPFFHGVGMLTARMHKQSLGRRARGFAQTFVGVTMSRFFFYLFVMVGYSMIFRADAARFIIWFMVFYMFYTIFEVFSLFRTIRKRD